jgi:ERCC4-type nuclease
MTTAEIVKSLPQHNRFTVRNALANMRSVGAVRSAGSRAYELAPGIDTEADYNALVRKFREEQSGRAIDPVSAVIRMAW